MLLWWYSWWYSCSCEVSGSFSAKSLLSTGSWTKSPQKRLSRMSGFPCFSSETLLLLPSVFQALFGEMFGDTLTSLLMSQDILTSSLTQLFLLTSTTRCSGLDSTWVHLFVTDLSQSVWLRAESRCEFSFRILIVYRSSVIITFLLLISSVSIEICSFWDCKSWPKNFVSL